MKLHRNPKIQLTPTHLIYIYMRYTLLYTTLLYIYIYVLVYMEMYISSLVFVVLC